MKIMIPGGSGQVGTVLARALHQEGHDVVVLSREPQPRPWRVVGWDGVSLGAWVSELNKCDAVINLAGRSVNCRYTAANREAIMQSRVVSTRLVGHAIARVRRPPGVWLQASTATIYAHRYDAPNDEASGLVGGNEPSAPSTWRFSIDVARAWEAAFASAKRCCRPYAVALNQVFATFAAIDWRANSKSARTAASVSWAALRA